MNPTGTTGHWVRVKDLTKSVSRLKTIRKKIITIDIFGVEVAEYMDHIKEHFTFFDAFNEVTWNLQINIPNVDKIETTDFFQELKPLKSTPLYFTLNYVNLLHIE